MSSRKSLKGWRYAAFVCSFVGAVGAALYPIVVRPFLYPEDWQEIQKVTRQGADREKIQPGGMKVWTDPFARKE